MAFILNINTAVSPASVCMARDMQALSFAQSTNQKEHASWLHPALKQVITDAGLGLKDIEAIAVTTGPGSYTGLRIGLSAAKGLSFALNIPLIAINLLEMMAHSVKTEEADYFCPVIDARRMEVFMAVYDKNMETVVAPCAMIVEPGSFYSWQAKGRIIFIGNGSEKIKQTIDHSNAVFSNRVVSSMDMIKMSENNFRDKRFADPAYVEPLYIKEFYSAAR
jgi:tRNA threonylcarbamoyladenosine biosynthesis protein TsaB